MSLRRDPDHLIASWVADSVGLGGPDYLSEVLAVVERTPQHRWAKWFPGAWTVAPAKAPGMRTRMVVVSVAVLLLAALVSFALAAGAVRRPSFALQGVVPLPGAVGAPFVGASDWRALGNRDRRSCSRSIPATGNDDDATNFPGAGSDLSGVLARPDAIWVADRGRRPRRPPGSLDRQGHRAKSSCGKPRHRLAGRRSGCGAGERGRQDRPDDPERSTAGCPMQPRSPSRPAGCGT